MDFYEHKSSYTRKKETNTKLYIGLGVFILLLTGLIIYFTYTSIINGAVNKDKTSKKSSTAKETHINTLDNTSSNSFAKAISADDEKNEDDSESAKGNKDTKNKEDEKDNDNEKDEDKVETTTTPKVAESAKTSNNTTSSSNNTNSSNQNNNSSSSEITTGSSSPTQKPVATATPTPTKKPSSGNQNLGTHDMNESSVRSFHLNNPGTLHCTFNGTPYAYANGYLQWRSSDGSLVKQYWSVSLNGSGYGLVKIELPSNVYDYTFDIISLDGEDGTSSCEISVSLANKH